MRAGSGERSPGASCWESLSPNATARQRPPDEPARQQGARGGAALAPAPVESTATRRPPQYVGPSALHRPLPLLSSARGGDPGPVPRPGSQCAASLTSPTPRGGRGAAAAPGPGAACGSGRRSVPAAPLTAALRGPARRPPPAPGPPCAAAPPPAAAAAAAAGSAD